MHRDAARPGRGQELAGVVPADAVDGSTNLEVSERRCRAEVPDGHAALALGGAGQPCSVLRKGQRRDGPFRVKVRGVHAGPYIKDPDPSARCARGEEMAVRVESCCCVG